MTQKNRRRFPYGDRVKYGRVWRWKTGTNVAGKPLPHWLGGGSNRVEIYPPHKDSPLWFVCADGLEVLNFGPDGEGLAFDAAEAFAQQNDAFRVVLGEQRYTKARRQRRRRG